MSPKGYDTTVGGAGGHLSGGERQRICIARAMLKDALVVIMDEATAYTDPENEALVQESVAQLVMGRTLIVIAHRLSTIQTADRIFVINDGLVEAEGKHEELLDHCALYRKMWEAHSMVRDEAESGKTEEAQSGQEVAGVGSMGKMAGDTKSENSGTEEMRNVSGMDTVTGMEAGKEAAYA